MTDPRTDPRDFAERLQAEITNHPHQNVDVIEHPNYEPFVKIKCRVCSGETYVKRDVPDA